MSFRFVQLPIPINSMCILVLLIPVRPQSDSPLQFDSNDNCHFTVTQAIAESRSKNEITRHIRVIKMLHSRTENERLSR